MRTYISIALTGAMAGLLTLGLAITGFAAEAEYKNIMDLDRYIEALSDRTAGWPAYRTAEEHERFLKVARDKEIAGQTYKNIIDRERYELALMDPREPTADYRNIIDLDRFVSALGDYQAEHIAYRNIMDRDRFEMALANQRDVDAWYNNVMTLEAYLAALGDPCLVEEEVGGVMVAAIMCPVRY